MTCQILLIEMMLAMRPRREAVVTYRQLNCENERIDLFIKLVEMPKLLLLGCHQAQETVRQWVP